MAPGGLYLYRIVKGPRLGRDTPVHDFRVAIRATVSTLSIALSSYSNRLVLVRIELVLARHDDNEGPQRMDHPNSLSLRS